MAKTRYYYRRRRRYRRYYRRKRIALSRNNINYSYNKFYLKCDASLSIGTPQQQDPAEFVIWDDDHTPVVENDFHSYLPLKDILDKSKEFQACRRIWKYFKLMGIRVLIYPKPNNYTDNITYTGQLVLGYISDPFTLETGDLDIWHYQGNFFDIIKRPDIYMLMTKTTVPASHYWKNKKQKWIDLSHLISDEDDRANPPIPELGELVIRNSVQANAQIISNPGWNIQLRCYIRFKQSVY